MPGAARGDDAGGQALGIAALAHLGMPMSDGGGASRLDPVKAAKMEQARCCRCQSAGYFVQPAVKHSYRSEPAR